jgi:NADPH:quinone reductase-like Zn-dependent oxidoreductase
MHDGAEDRAARSRRSAHKPAREQRVRAVQVLRHGRPTEVISVSDVAVPDAETCMALEGRYLPVGFNADPQVGFTGKPLRKVSIGNFSVLGVMLGYGTAVGPMRRMGMNLYPLETGVSVHAALCELVAQGKIRPAIGRRIRMDDVAAALEDHEARRTSGRAVVEILAT